MAYGVETGATVEECVLSTERITGKVSGLVSFLI